MPVSVDDVEKKLVTCSCVTLGWYQKKNILEHTGIVILFDDVKTFTIDYGTSDGVSYKLKAISGKQGGIFIDRYLSEYNFKSVICVLSKSELIPFIEHCLARNLQYHLMAHNCRNFVREVFEELVVREIISSEDWEKFLREIEEIERKDLHKVCSTTTFVGAAVGNFIAPGIGTVAGVITGNILGRFLKS